VSSPHHDSASYNFWIYIVDERAPIAYVSFSIVSVRYAFGERYGGGCVGLSHWARMTRAPTKIQDGTSPRLWSVVFLTLKTTANGVFYI